MGTLIARLERLRDLTPLEEGKRKHTWAALGRYTGVSRTHLGAIVSRAEKDPGSSIDRETAKKLAAPFGASVDWLLDGDGTAPGDRPDTPRYPNAEEAIAEMGAKWDDGTVAELRSLSFRSPTDFAVDTWISMGNQIQRARRSGQQLGRPLPDEDDTPPAGR